MFTPSLGRWSNLANIFQMGWNHQLVVEMIQFEEDWHPIFASWAPGLQPTTNHLPCRKVLQCPASFRVVKAGFPPNRPLKKGCHFPRRSLDFLVWWFCITYFFWKFHPDILGEMESNLTTHFSTKLKPPPRWDPFWGHQSFIYRNVEGFFSKIAQCIGLGW